MADVNNCLGKRKTLCSQMIFELEGDEEHLIASPDTPTSENGENNEPVSKMTKKEDTTEATDSNLYQEISQTSVETNASILDKLTELQEENKKLKRQLEEVSTKICNCNVKFSKSNDIDGQQNADITIKFHNDIIAEEYREEFKKFLKTFVVFKCLDHNLDINIIKTDTEDIDKKVDDSPSKKRKRKKSKSKLKESLFIVDTTPSSTKNTNPKYISKYVVSAEEANPEKDIKINYTSVCFNCEENHSLRDCTQPKNYTKINAARSKLKQQMSKPRYHLDEDQKYAHLKPGEISVDLKQALDICSDELPPYIYRMRMCGYPPGWMEDARVTHSNISLFDMDGKESSTKNSISAIDPDRVIEYPGFNMPMTEGIRDEYKYHGCPPYSEKCSKTMMLDYLNKMIIKEEDNLEMCDMELDQNSDEVIIPPGCEPAPLQSVPTPAKPPRLSPSLTDLEAKKMELLAALDDSTTNSSAPEEVTNISKATCAEAKKIVEETLNDSINLDDSYLVIDDSEEKKRNNESHCDEENNISVDGAEMNDSVHTPKVDILRKSTFGTPIVKGASPYDRLPDPDKFSKDISPVINFENLPNATGKYEQMNSLLQKIRRTLKTVNSETK